MRKEEVVAMMVMESVSEPQKPKNLEVRKENGLLYVEFDSTLQWVNRRNRNNREYRDQLKSDIYADHIKELQSKNSWCGEAGHPMSKDINRIMTIDPTLVSHHIPVIGSTGDKIHGKVVTLDNGGEGTKMTRMILQKVEPAFSLRALTKLTKRGDGSTVAEGRSHIICYDWVFLPSHKEAYRDTTVPIKKVQQIITPDSLVTESLVPVTESMIRDYITMESVNVNVISNVYEVTKESMELTPDLKKVIMRDGDQTFLVKLEDKIQQDIMGYMSKF